MIRGVIGRRGRGKTTLAMFYALKSPYRVIFDPRNLIETGAVHVENRRDLEDAFDAMDRGELTEIVVTPLSNVKGLFSATCIEVQAFIRAHPDRRLALLVDESRFVDLEIESFDWIIRCAPREQVDVIITCHRPVDREFPISVQAILDYWLIFHSTQAHDLKKIEERCGDHVARQVEQLEAFEYVEWDDGRGEATVHRDPTVWHVPLRARRSFEPLSQPVGEPIAPKAASGRLFEC